MRVLITGGAGYIGTQLTHVLNGIEEVSRIVVYDNFSRNNFNLFLGPQKLDSSKVVFVKGDVLDSRALKKQVAEVDVVVNLAAMVTTPFANHNPHQFDQNNNWGTAELVYAVEQSGISRFIHGSSTSVYGASDQELDIHSPLNPSTFYGISKMKAEEHVQRLRQTEIETFMLRFGNVYGYSKSMRFDSVINKFMFEANYYNKVRVIGSGNQLRTYIHVDRLVQILKNMVLGKYLGGDYNLVESTYSINQIAEILKQIYPELEMSFVNQNMEMRSLAVHREEQFDELAQRDCMLDDLKAFKDRFSFSNGATVLSE